MSRLVIEASGENGIPVVTVKGEVDIASADEVVQAVGAADSSAPGVVLAVGQVSFMDSTGLGAIARLHRQFEASGRKLVLAVSPSRAVRRILQLTGMESRLHVVDEVKEAVVLLADNDA